MSRGTGSDGRPFARRPAPGSPAARRTGAGPARASPPAAEGGADSGQELDRVVVVELLEDVVGEGQAAEVGLVVGRHVGVADGVGAGVGGLPELAVDPPAAGKEVEAAVVEADLVGAEQEPVLVAEEELAGLL